MGSKYLIVPKLFCELSFKYCLYYMLSWNTSNYEKIVTQITIKEVGEVEEGVCVSGGRFPVSDSGRNDCVKCYE